MYGRPRHGNPDHPIDNLIYIVLSNRTSSKVAAATYCRLREAYDTWEDVLAYPLAKLRRILRAAGLSDVKSRQIRGAIRIICRDFGCCELSPLRRRPATEVEDYLVSLPGISVKVARCIMMYTLGFDVLPVDTHVYRICHRLGWTDRKRADQCHGELDLLIPTRRRFAFHVDCVSHGRSVCRGQPPLCGECCISKYCHYFQLREMRR